MKLRLYALSAKEVCDVIEGISDSTLQYKILRSDAVDRLTHKLINLLTPNFRKRIS